MKWLSFGLILLLSLSACGPAAGIETEPEALPTAPSAEDGATPDQPGTRRAVFAEVENDVQVRPQGDADFAPAAVGQEIQPGGEVQTGEDGTTRLDLLPEGTIVRIGPNSLFTLEQITQGENDPFTQLKLWAGQVWVILNGGEMQIETPSGVAAVRGSYMSVSYDPEQETFAITCLEGECTLANEYGEVELSDGEESEILGEDLPPEEVEEMTEEDFEEWFVMMGEEDPELLEYIPEEYWEEIIPTDFPTDELTEESTDDGTEPVTEEPTEPPTEEPNSMKKAIAAIALGVIFLSACGTAPVVESTSDRQATFTLVLNEVQSRAGDEVEFGPASQGDLLAVGGQAQSGETGRARLDLAPDGTIIRLGPNTLFTLEALEEEAGTPLTRARLFLGQVWIILSGGTLDVESDYGIAAVRGSLMSVTFDPATGMDVTCLEGHCSLRNEAGSVDLAGGQASSIRIRGEAPSPPREMDEGEVRAWEETIPEADEVLHPGEAEEPGEAEGPLNTQALQFNLSNTCSAEDAPDIVGDWRWLFERLADADGPALSETVIVPNGQSVDGTLPAGQYLVIDWAPNGEQHGPQLVNSDQGGLQVELCPEGGGALVNPSPGGENPPPGPGQSSSVPTRYELINNCPEGTWHWQFNGPATIVVDIPAGSTASGDLLPVGTYSAVDWMDGAEGTNDTPELPPGGFITARGCPDQ